jgi:peptidoglycan/LPS O-acetylase OafA/YrhL
MPKKHIHLPGIESLRGIAAIILIIFHVRTIPQIDSGIFLPVLIYFNGPTIVPLFFTISGFSVMLGYEHLFDQPAMLIKFFSRRFFRIAPLFYVMIIIWLIIYFIFSKSTSTLWVVLINVLLAFGFFPEHHAGIVPAGWTIGVEWIFYIFFPGLLLCMRRSFTAIALCLLAFWFAIIWPTLFPDILSRLPDYIVQTQFYRYQSFLTNFVFFVWGMWGVSIYRTININLPHNRLTSVAFLASACVIFSIISFITGPKNPLFSLGIRSLWMVVVYLLLIVGAAVQCGSVLNTKVFRFAGQISYGLYLLNPLVIMSFDKLGLLNKVYQLFSVSKELAFMICCVISLLAVGMVSWITYRLVEIPGIQLGEWLVNKFSQSFPKLFPSAAINK